MSLHDLEVAAARFALGLLPSSAIRRAADDALNDGLYSPELAEVALDRHPIMSEVGPLFEKALTTAGIQRPSRQNAVWLLLGEVLGKVARGEVPPREGVLEVVQIYSEVRGENLATQFLGEEYGIHHLLGCFYAKDDLNERPNQVSFDGKYGAAAHQALDSRLVELAKAWMESRPLDGRRSR